MGHATADWSELQQCLGRRRIKVQEIDQVFQYLSEPDPAGIMRNVGREDVARVAVHMNVLVTPAITIYSPYWEKIVIGEPVARTIYYHEIQEIIALVGMGVLDLEALSRISDEYWTAHSLASWREAQYWGTWAGV